jgi:hypothetical protein
MTSEQSGLGRFAGALSERRDGECIKRQRGAVDDWTSGDVRVHHIDAIDFESGATICGSVRTGERLPAKGWA